MSSNAKFWAIIAICFTVVICVSDITDMLAKVL